MNNREAAKFLPELGLQLDEDPIRPTPLEEQILSAFGVSEEKDGERIKKIQKYLKLTEVWMSENEEVDVPTIKDQLAETIYNDLLKNLELPPTAKTNKVRVMELIIQWVNEVSESINLALEVGKKLDEIFPNSAKPVDDNQILKTATPIGGGAIEVVRRHGKREDNAEPKNVSRVDLIQFINSFEDPQTIEKRVKDLVSWCLEKLGELGKEETIHQQIEKIVKSLIEEEGKSDEKIKEILKEWVIDLSKICR